MNEGTINPKNTNDERFSMKVKHESHIKVILDSCMLISLIDIETRFVDTNTSTLKIT